MGIYDRDYVNPRLGARQGRKVGRPGFSASGLTVTAWLILINVAIFFLSATALPQLGTFGYFSTATFFRLEVWRLVSFQFLHADFTHILFNMFGLWVFGRLVEDHLGKRRYLAFYLICGICGALLYLILNLLGWGLQVRIPGVLSNDPRMPLIGASAGVFGVIVACGRIAPNMVVQLLIPPVPLKMKWFAYGYVAFALVMLLMGAQNAGGQAAHIGGAIAGFFFIKHHHLLRDFFDVFRNSNKPHSGKRERRKRRAGPAPRDRELEAEVDRILDKQRTQGIHSLTERERKTLREATERLRGA